MEGWLRPALILGAVAVLIVLNVLEFRAKRRRDAAELAELPPARSREEWLAERRHTSLQNIEQVLHILNTVLIALLIAVLTA